MSTLQTYTFDDFVTSIQNQLANGSPKFTDFREGSASYALAQAIAGNSIALQGLVVDVFDVARLGTSYGSDVDSFVNDYGLTRDPAVPSSGPVAFNRFNTTVTATIPVGTIIQTAYSQLQFVVIADTSNSNYNPIINAYVMEDGVSTINVTVQAVIAGSGSNFLAANTTFQIVSGVIGINTVTPVSDFINGADPETDVQLKERFLNFISSLSRATTGAIEAAIMAIQPNLTFQIIEGFDFTGATFTAGFIVVIDDGTGNISLPLQNQILAALNKTRAAGIECKVYPPTNVTINVSVHIIYGAGQSPQVVQANVQAAIASVINGAGVGNTVHIGTVENAIQNVSGVQAYSAVTLNTGTTDITISDTQLARMGTLTFA